MTHSILIIDDEPLQANNLAKALKKEKKYIDYHVATREQQIKESISDIYFDIAIVDLRMDEFSIDGFSIIRKIIEINPFANIIIVSAFTQEYLKEIQDILLSGKIIGLIEKTEFSTFVHEIVLAISKYEEHITKDPSETSKAFLNLYANAKNITDPHQKGVFFENFVSLFFSNMGFLHINKRIKDLSLNEVDLIIRNDIKDPFFSKFKPYILVECKNKPSDGVSKNDFIQFYSKLKNTNGLADLGFLITSGYIARTTYIEAVRNSQENIKIIFISNPEIEQLINSDYPLNELKKIIDNQVKDN